MVVAFDISESRVKFAKAYISPITGKPIIEHVFLNTVLPSTPIDAPAAKGHSHGNGPTPAGVADGEIDDHDEHELPEGDRKWAHAQLRIEEILKQVGLEEEGGFDRVIEATGAGDCMLLGVAAVKQGGVCECYSNIRI
jgi:D-xylulose reductase